jgi:GH15 family glucan-1,4-alpha-glucosidase
MAFPAGTVSERNWDYRYTWIRDAAFTIYGFARIGLTEEADRFMDWLIKRIHEANADGSLQTVYGIDGRKDLEVKILDHLEGYRNSRPVRVGNEAYKQLQLDIYGELMDAVYLYNKYETPISYNLWVGLRRLINWLCELAAERWRHLGSAFRTAAFPLLQSHVLDRVGSRASTGRQTLLSRRS